MKSLFQLSDEDKCAELRYSLKEYLRLFAVFFKVGLVTFGGGLAMLPILERELSGKRKWATREQLLDYFAIGQATPGIIAVNVATFIGYNRKKTLGGCIATLGVVTPSVIIITILALFLENFSEIAAVQKALAGINVAVAALLTKAFVGFAKNTVKNVFSFGIFAAGFSAIYFFKIDSVFIIVFSGFAGILYSLIIKRNTARRKNEKHTEQQKTEGDEK